MKMRRLVLHGQNTVSRFQISNGELTVDTWDNDKYTCIIYDAEELRQLFKFLAAAPAPTKAQKGRRK